MVIYTEWDCSLIQTCTPNGHLYRVRLQSHPNLHTKRSSIQSETAVSSKPAHQTVIYTEWDCSLIQTCTPNGHLYRVRLQSHPNLHTKRSSKHSETTVSSKPAHQTVIYREGDCSLIQTCKPNGHLNRVRLQSHPNLHTKRSFIERETYTRCRIATINSPDDGHMAARNM